MSFSLTASETQTIRLALMYALGAWSASMDHADLMQQFGEEARRLQRALREDAESTQAPTTEFSLLSLHCLQAVAEECAQSKMSDVPLVAQQMQTALGRLSHLLLYGGL